MTTAAAATRVVTMAIRPASVARLVIGGRQSGVVA